MGKNASIEIIRNLGEKFEGKSSRLVKANGRLIELKKELSRKVRQRTKALSFLYRIERDISNKLKMEDVLKVIVEKMSSILNVKICSILLIDDKTGKLSIKCAKGLEQKILKDSELEVGDNISGWVVRHNKPILVKNIDKDARFVKRNGEKYYNESLMSVPLAIKDKVIGVINVNNKKSRRIFNQEDFRLLKQIAAQVAIVIENARLYRSLSNLYMRTITTLAATIDARDHYTRRHSEMVAKYAVAIAEAMKLPPERVELIRQASHLHDIGKIGVHDFILLKPDKLTDEEWEEVKLHSVKGAEILAPLVVFLNGVIDMVKQHHERYDGRGYPGYYRDEKIDIGARIMAVADAFDAMLSERPYRKAYSKKKAIEELRENSGTQFDPKVVETFLKVLNKGAGLIQNRYQ
ncbi:HD domain-containing protein [bacterium]|nr:HD domain-containing protein [bacterium]NIN92822.1 HD domain-containing protein [bacterium]NIO18777.1 HD domain-containing protein [bacterium]NIO73858.1 HD domain-containing protein [bacterium]